MSDPGLEEANAAIDHLAALERLNKIVAGFASMVSHETRTALVGIQGLSELIRDGELSTEEVRSAAEDIFNEAIRINSRIGDMLDLNRLETGRASLRMNRVQMNSVIKDVASRTESKQWSPTLTLELDEELPEVMGDADRLDQVVENVLGFAVSTSSNDNRIKVSSHDQGSNVEVVVQSDALKPVGFEDWLYGRYERYEQRPSAIIGAGLGLAIARVIAELHGGKIWVEPSRDGGSAFHWTLPAALDK